MEKELILIGCILLVGCTIIDTSNIPFCQDINVTGTDCHYIGDMFDRGVYNYSNGICKQYEPNLLIEHPKIGVCFSTLEGNIQIIKDAIEQCWNCTKKEECMDYNKLNYTTLKISRGEFEKMPCYRQRDWINGWCYPSECNKPNPPVCTAIYAVACYNEETPESKYSKNLYSNNTLPEEEPINTINISRLNTSFKSNPNLGKPANERVPDDYIPITVYEMVCQCNYGNGCPGFVCPCNKHCYNQSKVIWVPKNNCEMPIHCYTT